MDDPAFRLDYWKVAAALCRAFEDARYSALFWRVVVELGKTYPQFDWRNVMTDSWPLDAEKPPPKSTHTEA